MGEIKSTFEIALEKSEKIKVPNDVIYRQKYVPEGNKLAARYMDGKIEEDGLLKELSRYGDDFRRYVVYGAQEIFLRHIRLPETGEIQKTNENALKGLWAVRIDKKKIKPVYTEIINLLNGFKNSLGQIVKGLEEELAKPEIQKNLKEADVSEVSLKDQTDFRELYSKFTERLEGCKEMLKADL